MASTSTSAGRNSRRVVENHNLYHHQLQIPPEHQQQHPVSNHHHHHNRIIMENVLYKLHSQICNFTLQNTSSKIRIFLEQLFLTLAICGFSALLVSHITFVHRSSASVAPIPMSSSSSIPMPNTTTSSKSLRRNNIPLTCLPSIEGFQRDVDVTHLVLVEETQESFAFTCSGNNPLADVVSTTLLVESSNGKGEEECQLSPRQQQQERNNMTSLTSRSCQHVNEFKKEIYLSYSRFKGYIYLSPETCAKHNITTQFVAISKSNTKCFGEPFLQQIVFTLLGPYTVMLNWLLPIYGVTGYVFNPKNERLIDLGKKNNHHHQQQKYLTTTATFTTPTTTTTTTKHFVTDSWWKMMDYYYYIHMIMISKITIIVKTCFLYFITTTLVSFTFRETQDRMLEFTIQLKSHVQQRQPLHLLITKHVIDNLVFVPIMVGMMFFLIEFYNGDYILSFLVMSIVWLGEVYSVISIRSHHGILFYPITFFFLFCLFHIYLFSFPFGFSYTALTTTWIFMIHTNIFFWNRYELPAVALGLITETHPRLNSSHYINNSMLSNSNESGNSDTTAMRNNNATNNPSATTTISRDAINSNTNNNGNHRNNNLSNILPPIETTTISRRATATRPPTTITTTMETSSSSTTGAPATTTTTSPVPAIPIIGLSPRNSINYNDNNHSLLAFHHHNTSSVSSAATTIADHMSRATSGLSLNNGNYNNDDESSSYMIYMDGEVVMHNSNNNNRNFPSSPSVGSSINSIVGSCSANTSLNSLRNLVVQQQQHGNTSSGNVATLGGIAIGSIGDSSTASLTSMNNNNNNNNNNTPISLDRISDRDDSSDGEGSPPPPQQQQCLRNSNSNDDLAWLHRFDIPSTISSTFVSRHET